jgi:hypothetical protein
LHSTTILGIDSISHLGIAYSGRKEWFFFFNKILEQKDADRFIVQTNQISELSLERFENFVTEMFTTTNVKITPLCYVTVCLDSISNLGYMPPRDV